VRISPELHKKAVHKALLLGISLNRLIQKAIEEEVKNL
jgi:predicted HicB family RNase H-like nuclease